MMKTKAYTSFNDIHGNSYGFQDYETFADWWYSIPRRRMIGSLDSSDFKKLERAASQSREARATA
jgi:hypothetical protein